MADQSDIINSNPIGKELDGVREFMISICERCNVVPSPDAWNQLLSSRDINPRVCTYFASFLVTELLRLPASHSLCSKTGRSTLDYDLSRLESVLGASSPKIELDYIKPLLNAVITNKPDKEIWDAVYDVIAKLTPPPQSNTSSPWVPDSEHHEDIDAALEKELVQLHPGISSFCETYFGRVAGLDAAYKSVFKKCTEGSTPLFDNGWSGWPKEANTYDVLSWFTNLIEKVSIFAEEYKPTPASTARVRKKPLAQLKEGTLADHKLSIGFSKDDWDSKYSQCDYWRIFAPGELRSDPAADEDKSTWLDIGRYATKVLTAQDTRRFILGFTLCGSLMRVWEFDRLGGTASDVFDINKNGLRFIYVTLGFLWMTDEDVGFDPTIVTENGRHLVTITRNGKTERFIVDNILPRNSGSLVSRATTCWLAHREDDPQTSFVIKDSWQDWQDTSEREEEGELLKYAAEKGVDNVVRYYHHETVVVRGQVDDIRNNVRGELDIMKTNLCPELALSSTTEMLGTKRKRSSSRPGTPPPPSKRPCLGSADGSSALPNRIHRRIIVRDYGKKIHKASSRVALLKALVGCINGHKSLHEAGILHRDISIGNLIINEDANNPSPFSFLIDLDHAIKETRLFASEKKVGTLVFMSIGVLMGKQHSFMDDLESFFWVLFWICINYEARGEYVGPNELADRLDDKTDQLLSIIKKSLIDEEPYFLRESQGFFTPYYQPLVRWVNELRKVVFPNDKRWMEEDPLLYARMTAILQEAQKDPEVLAEG
ncbi:serine/threonine-protein kinase Sgk2 [Xylaria curta]|nr:serine/threonine-protein kinase Sgk2 [Xylaria curta]